MIAVIGGSGKIGSPIIRNLAKTRMAARALTSNQKSADRLQTLGATEVVIGDFLRVIDAEDLGEAIAKVFTDNNLRGGTYEMAGPEALTFTEMAAIISEELHRSVQVIPLDEKAREAFARTQGWKDYASEAFRTMCDHYDKYGFPGGNPLVLTSILGRSPTDYRSFVKRMIAGNE